MITTSGAQTPETPLPGTDPHRTPENPPTDAGGGSNTPAPDASDPAQLRHAAAVIDSYSRSLPGSPGNQRNTVAEHLRAAADRLDVDAADRALAEQIAGDVWKGVGPTPSTLDDAITEAVLAGIRAGRDAEAG